MALAAMTQDICKDYGSSPTDDDDPGECLSEDVEGFLLQTLTQAPISVLRASVSLACEPQYITSL